MKIKKSIYKIPRNVNPIQDGVGRGAKSPLPTSFSPITSKNVRLSPQNFLTFSFNSFSAPVQSFNVIPSA